MIYYVFRLFLAALHFSENSTRTQAVTMDGTRQYRISYPKGRKGEGVVKEMWERGGGLLLSSRRLASYASVNVP
jgi:hypothetical protein